MSVMHEQAPTLLEAARRCSACSRLQPIDEFRRLRSGSDHRRWDCNDCHRAAQRERKHACKVKLLSVTRARLMKVRSAQEFLECFTVDLVRKFGGLDGFTSFWAREVFAAAKRSPGGPSAAKHLCTIARLAVLTMQTQMAARASGERPLSDVDQMSDAEIVAELERLIAHNGRPAVPISWPDTMHGGHSSEV